MFRLSVESSALDAVSAVRQSSRLPAPTDDAGTSASRPARNAPRDRPARRAAASNRSTSSLVNRIDNFTVEPADAAVPVGKEFRIDIFAEKARAITGETMKLFFDPKIVEFRDAAGGELMGTGQGKTGVAVKSRSSDGEMELRFRRMSGPFRNEGQLLSLTFMAKAPGVSPVRVILPEEPGGRESADLTGGKGIVRVR